MNRVSSLVLLVCVLTSSSAEPDEGPRHFAITVVDEETSRGVPLVALRTVHGVRYYTDCNGVAAIDEPELMGRDVFFHVSSHGYEFPKDGFGFRGKTLLVTRGGSAKLTIRRINIAQRLYRVTGGGIYRDSVLIGRKTPLAEPLLNGLVVGSDSVLNAVYRNKTYWFWGDTNRPAYPLGNFHVPGAISELPAKGGLDPESGVDLRYFLDERGFAKPTMHMPGKGPTWMTALVPLTDREGRERLFASYIKVEPPLKVYARGLAVWNDEKREFDKLADVDMLTPLFPSGHAFRNTDDGVEYVYFAHPLPLTRVRATAEAFADMKEYQAYTCLKEGSQAADGQIDRDPQGHPRYAWRKNTPPASQKEETQLIAVGKLKPSEARFTLRDRDSGKRVTAHSGSVYWNAYRRRFVMIFVQSGGTSFLGEVWCAEAETPVGPWGYAVKVVTHDRYSFYNPKQHPMFDKENGRLIYFEGTYSHTFSGNPDPTPRYDYNQILYKLDLSDPRVALPAPVYDLSPGDVPTTFGTARTKDDESLRIAFFALDRSIPGAVPMRAEDGRLRLGKAGEKGALFYALPVDARNPPAAVTPLYEYRHRHSGRRAYSVDLVARLGSHYQRVEPPLCLVWKTPNEEE